MPAHARFPPSAMARILACPASVRLTEENGTPAQDVSMAAELGTLAHDIARRCLMRGVNVSDVLRMPAPDLLMVQTYLDEIRHVLQAHAHERPELLVEERVDVDEECWGTVDAAIIVPQKRAYVFDLKYGRHPVEAIGNPQLLTYALAISRVTGLQQFDLYIVQPRAASGYPVRRWRAAPVHLRRHAARFVAARAQVPVAPPVPGEHCRYCPVRQICPLTSSPA